MWNLLIKPITDLINNVVDKIAPDAEMADRLKHELTIELLKAQDNQFTQEVELLVQQIAVNKIEGQSESLFKSGWRPAIGWVCGFGLAYSVLLEPVLRFVSVVIFDYTGAFPNIDTNITMQVLMGMLGLAGMRSFDKTKRSNI